MYMYVCLCVYVCMYVYLCVYVCMYVCMYVTACKLRTDCVSRYMYQYAEDVYTLSTFRDVNCIRG